MQQLHDSERKKSPRLCADARAEDQCYEDGAHGVSYHETKALSQKS